MMQHAACSPAEPSRARQGRPQPAWSYSFVSQCVLPDSPRCASGLSGRPFCRIYLDKRVWILELEPASGAWLEPGCGSDRMGHPHGPSRLTFPALSAAIAYAERHGLDYRVIPPPQRRVRKNTGRREMEPGLGLGN